MNITDIAKAISKETGITVPQAKQAFNASIDAIKADLKIGNSTTIQGFGTFSHKVRQAREGRNPQTGGVIQIAECNTANFKVSKTLKDYLN